MLTNLRCKMHNNGKRRMSKKIFSGSESAAIGISLLKPDYIITSPTKQNFLLNREVSKIAGEKIETSETVRGCASVQLGASSAGSRAVSIISGPGIPAATDVLLTISEMRLPCVSVCPSSNSSVLNSYGDGSDCMAARDCGWVQLHCENNQEIIDTIMQSQSISDSCMIPVLVCYDSFPLSEMFEEVEVPENIIQTSKNPAIISSEKVSTVGAFIPPEYFEDLKKQQEKAMISALEQVKKANSDFKSSFNRSYGNGLVEEYKIKDAETVIVAMGSVCGTVRSVIEQNKNVGLLKIKCFRPFPFEEVKKALEKATNIGVIDSSNSPGGNPPLFSEISSVIKNKKITSFVLGLGGSGIFEEDIDFVIEKTGVERKFVGVED